MSAGRILVVEDDPSIVQGLTLNLTMEGYEVTVAQDGVEAVEKFASDRFDLVILDLMLPRMNGLEVIEAIRRRDSDLPVLFLSARDAQADKVKALELGGDDYITKPFSPRELVARVKAMLRRQALDREAPAEPTKPPKLHGELELDAERFRVRFAGRDIVLTVTEFAVLDALLSQPGKVYTRSELVDRAYEFDHHVTERTIDSHVRRIRKKFDADGEPIETVYGLGYRLGLATAKAR